MNSRTRLPRRFRGPTRKCPAWVAAAAAFALCPSLLAATDGLTALQAARLDTVASRYFIQRCCLSTLLECARSGNTCSIGRRLWEFAAWRCGADSVTDSITAQIDKRYRGFVDANRFPIDTARAPWLGNPAAPVVIVAYVSASCNLCKRVVGALCDSVAVGGLKNKARLTAKPIGRGIGERALLAAHRDGKFWKMFLAMKTIKSRLTEDNALHLADSIGIPPGRFRELMKDPHISDMLEANTSEADKNGAKVTPTLFLNGKRYASYKDPRWVVDAALYETDPR